MSHLIYKASELRRPLKMVRTEGESCKVSEAKRVAVGITHNGKEYGVVMRTRKVGYQLQLFYPIMEMGVQDETQMVDIVPGDEMVVLDARSLDRALATFGTQDIFIDLNEQRLRLANDMGSFVELEGVVSRQLELPFAGMPQRSVASSVASGIDADVLGSEAVQVSALALCNALLPARGVTTMGGNRGDMKGVHIKTLPLTPPWREGGATANGATAGAKVALRVVGAHEKAIFVYEDEEACAGWGYEDTSANDPNLRGSSPLPTGRGLGRKSSIGAIISPDSAKRLRELLLNEVAGDQDEKGLSGKRVWLKQLGEEYLLACCGNWMMRIDLEDICQQDCDEYLQKPGTIVYETRRAALLQVVSGLLLMGETEAYVTFDSDCLWFEGESLQHRGKLRVDGQRYGADVELPLRKYALKPMQIVLSAAAVAEGNKNVKLLADPDDTVLGIECEEFMGFVR